MMIRPRNERISLIVADDGKESIKEGSEEENEEREL
jgi:hypothetical protein